MLKGLAVLLLVAIESFAQSKPPKTLQIYREILKPGSYAAYSEVETEIARDCIELGFPHPYVGLESITGPKEVWYFNGWESSDEQKQVTDEVAKNTPLVKAFDRTAKRKASLREPVEVFANFQQHSGKGAPWSMGVGRFLVITVTKGNARIDGTVFQTSDGTRFILTPTKTRKEADAKAAAVGSETRVFAVRPGWSKPAREWVAADPVFWQTGSALKLGR